MVHCDVDEIMDLNTWLHISSCSVCEKQMKKPVQIKNTMEDLST